MPTKSNKLQYIDFTQPEKEKKNRKRSDKQTHKKRHTHTYKLRKARHTYAYQKVASQGKAQGYEQHRQYLSRHGDVAFLNAIQISDAAAQS